MIESKKALRALEPQGLATDDASWQQRKRSDFRVVVLDAVIDCLAELGYAQTTTEMVAARAKVPRGTMLHHFANRQALIEAGIEYAFFKRMQQFIAGVQALSEEDRVHKNAGIRLDWQHYLTREYRAYRELHIAAKTDPELRKVFIPRAKLYDGIWRSEVARAFPEWAKDKVTLDRAGEFVRATLEGLALNQDIWDEDNINVVLQFVADTAIMLRQKKLKFAAPTRSKVRKIKPD